VKITERVLHDVPLWKGARVQVVEVTRTTVKASFVVYQYYLVRSSKRAGISRHAAVLLGVKV
jgi:hypothetical protein